MCVRTKQEYTHDRRDDAEFGRKFEKKMRKKK